MVLSFSLVDTMNQEQVGSFDFEAFWRRSLTTSTASRLLAKQITSPLAEEAFIGGLLADLGMIAAWRCARDDYQPVLEAWASSDRPLCEIEREMIETSHAELSRELLRGWCIPETLCVAVGAHHGEGIDELNGPAADLAGIICSAALIAELFCQDIAHVELDRVKEQVRAATGIGTEPLEELLEVLDTHVRETASMLSVEVGPTIDYATLQAEAAVQLAQLSMQAEVERAQTNQQAELMREEIDQMREEQREILAAASTDRLTQCANRAAFDDELKKRLGEAQKRNQPLGLIMLDVDHFKRFNDTYGHQAGDAVLQSLGEWLRKICDNVGFAARYGGEEFAVIVANETAGQIKRLAEEIRLAIQAGVVQHDGKQLRITASFGATTVEPLQSPVDAKTLIERADQQLYNAKRNGRNRVELDA
jgi:diguanylate cyclase (GGDEF)-like protein